jgi:Flp pilus assembly protein TadG
MRALFNQIRRFRNDERGVFAVIFGILSIVLVATSGAVVDFVGVQQARVRAQAALDSAALALQPQIYTSTTAELRSLAQNLLVERMTDSGVSVTVESANVVINGGTLFLQARLTVPMSFVSLVGISEINARIASQATRKKLAVEVTMVLDNSGSMGSYSRMTNLKAAASNATEILFGGETTQPNVFIGIIPFTSFVNVGPSRANSPWMDTAGLSSIAADNFDNDSNDSTPFNGPVNRLSLYDQISNMSWRGCVDARPHTVTGAASHLDTDDTVPVNNDPDTLIVPAFGPDTPDSWSSWLADYEDDDAAPACNGISGGSDRERQERLCKYSGSIDTSTWGPNFDCPSAELLPLTNVKQPVLDAIDAMVASGATNIHMGTIWGFRALSPTEPFTEGAPYDESTAKAMIIMTDGENTMYSRNNMNGAAYYSPYGYPYNGRLGAVGWSSSQMRAEMDVRTLESCANAKARDITIYTIGLNPPNSTTRNMLTDCATSPANAYFPSQASELNGVFAEIANQLSALRLAQ